MARTDAIHVDIENVEEAFKWLGIEPLDMKNVQRVVIDPTGIHVTRARRDGHGQRFLTGGEAATEVTTIGIKYPARKPKTSDEEPTGDITAP